MNKIQITNFIENFNAQLKKLRLKILNGPPWILWACYAFAAIIVIKLSWTGYLWYRGNPIPSTSVQVAKAANRAMPVFISAPGSIEADQTVSITPQVTGIVKHIAFDDGEQVSKGQILFELDQAPFLESVRQANATLLRDQATLKQNQADAKRYAALADLEYVTRQQAEQTATVVLAQEAVVESDLAQVRQAEIQLSYTRIRTPISGKAGNINVHPGDLAIAGGPTPLVIINQSDPLLVNFSLTQDQLKTLLLLQQKKPLTVNISADENEESFLATGELQFIDNSISQQTGTVLLKAKVSNPDNKLWPGMMVHTQLILRIEPNAVVIPAVAIQLDQQGSFVYSFEENKAVVRRVSVSRHIKDLVVIEQGLSGTETVLITLPPDLADGAPVHIDDATPGSPSKT